MVTVESAAAMMFRVFRASDQSHTTRRGCDKNPYIADHTLSMICSMVPTVCRPLLQSCHCFSVHCYVCMVVVYVCHAAPISLWEKNAAEISSLYCTVEFLTRFTRVYRCFYIRYVDLKSA